MSRIFAIGEIVYDIIFKNNQPQQANPGGSMLNSAISLSRIGLPVFFIGETGNDTIGTIICNFLQSNNIHTDYITSYEKHKSSIALAFINESNDASYIFHKDYPQERLPYQLPLPQIGDFVLFGSSFALNQEVRSKLLTFLQNAKKNGATIIYDPNYRKQSSNQETILQRVKENISFAHITRGSDEDFQTIFNTSEIESLYPKIKDLGCKNLILTRNKFDIKIVTQLHSKTHTVPSINAINTIGAGDNFNAGIIYGLSKNAINSLSLDTMSIEIWDNIISNAIAFSAEVCQSMENYISWESAKLYR